jgi:hypothetical protein
MKESIPYLGLVEVSVFKFPLVDMVHVRSEQETMNQFNDAETIQSSLIACIFACKRIAPVREVCT